MPASELVAATWLVLFLAWVLAFHSLNQSSGGRLTTWPVVIGLATVALLVALALRVDDRPSQVALVAALGAAPMWIALAGARRASSPVAASVAGKRVIRVGIAADAQQIRYLRPQRSTLEEVFLKAVEQP